MARKPNVLTLPEFLKLKGKQKGPIVVYFNADQWANVTKSVSPGKGKRPERTLTLALTEIPGLEGGLGTLHCPIECSGPIGAGEFEFHCDCPAPELPTPGEPEPPTFEFCTTIRVGKNGTLRCVGKCGTGRSCRLSSWNFKTPLGIGLIVSSCACARS
jgi:hypothetical protein